MLKVGLVQTRTPASLDAALAHTAPLVREAAAAGASLIVTPECTNILQRDRAKLFAVLAPAESDPVVAGLTAADEGLATAGTLLIDWKRCHGFSPCYRILALLAVSRPFLLVVNSYSTTLPAHGMPSTI